MAMIKHIAIATQTPEATASVYRRAFDLEVVGRIDSEDVEGLYLSDGNVNLALLRFKRESAVGDGLGLGYTGLHHIGFQVDDAQAADLKLRQASCLPSEEINVASLRNGRSGDHRGRNTEIRYRGPDGVQLDVSRAGWVGT